MFQLTLKLKQNNTIRRLVSNFETIYIFIRKLWLVLGCNDWDNYTVKVKFYPKTCHEGPEGEYGYSSTLSLTSALHGGGWSRPRPSRFTPGDSLYPLYRRLGGSQGLCGRERKILALSGFNPRTVRRRGDVLTGRHLRKRDQLENPGVVGRIILRWILRRNDRGCELHWSGSG